MQNLYHIDGKCNLADFGTRPDLVTADLLRPGGKWLNGKPWMTLPIEQAKEDGILKSTKDIIIDNETKKVLRQGANFDEYDDSNYVANLIDVKKVAEIYSLH